MSSGRRVGTPALLAVVLGIASPVPAIGFGLLWLSFVLASAFYLMLAIGIVRLSQRRDAKDDLRRARAAREDCERSLEALEMALEAKRYRLAFR